MELRTTTNIDASPEVVWEILTDFQAYGEWNPFIREIEGVAQKGARLRVRMTPPEGKAMNFKPVVQSAEPALELRWLGRLWLPRLFDGEHVFELEPDADGSTRLTQRETFRGVLVPFLAHSLNTNIRLAFEQMNQALKERAEQRSQAR